MQVPFLADSLDTQMYLAPYMIWSGNSTPSNIAIDTTIVNTKSIEAQIHEQLGNIYVNGIGYSDIVSVISIPLIIALFAFSFPFIFQTINRINDKYASKYISTLFRTSTRYNLFWVTNFFSIIYVLSYGASSLLWKEFILIRYPQIWNCITIFVAFSYVCVVIMFVGYCINFNNPNKLLKIIKRRYYLEKSIVWLQRKWVFCKVLLRVSFRHKDKAGNSIYKSARDTVCRWNNSIPEDNYVSRLIGVASFAVKENDFSLFQNVLSSLDNIIDIERKDYSYWYSRQKDDIIKESAVHYRTMRFFDELLTTYRPFSNAYMPNESIIFKMVGAFDRSKYMSYADSFHLAICMRKMLDSENEALLEKYIDYTRYYFKYLRNLPKVFFIKGGLTEGRADVEKESDKSWNNLCCFHYAVLAYAFDKCKYSLLRTHLERDHYSDYNLYPMTGADVLIRYAHCIKDTWSLHNDKLFERKVDIKSLLNKYTATLLLLIPEIEEMGHSISENLTKEIIDTIESSKSDLEKEMNFIKKNTALLNLYPNLAEANLKDRFSHFLDVIKTAFTLSENGKQEDNKGCRTISFVHGFIGRLLGKTRLNNPKAPRINLYTQKLNEEIINDFAIRFKQLSNDVSRSLPYGLFTSELCGKSAEEMVNPCQMIICKLCFLDKNYYCDGYYLYHEYVEQFSTRLIYLALSSFRKMKIKEVNVKSPNFDIFFERFTKGKRENYVLIGVDSPFESILNISFFGHNRFYEGTVPYINIDSSMRSLLTDLDDYIFFKDSLLIVSKKDLPVIVGFEDDKNTRIDYSDISDESKMQLCVRTTVDAYNKLVFNPNAKIAMVRLKQMNL